jgi:hypothetical protein
VSSWKHGVTDKDHFRNGDLQDVPEFPDSVRLIDAMLGNIDRSRAAQTDGKFWD